MRICYLYSNYCLRHFTGQAGLMEKIIHYAVNNGKEVSVISNNVKKQIIKIGKVNYYLAKGKGDYFFYFLNFWIIVNYIKKINPDILHIHGALFAIYISFINLILHLPMTVTLSESIDQLNPILKSLLNYSLSNFKVITVTSDYIKKQLIQLGVMEEKITVVRIGLDKTFLEYQSPNFTNNDIVYFGDNNYERGFDIVYRLAQRLPSLNFRILLRYRNKKLVKLPNMHVLYYPYKTNFKQLISDTKLVILPFRYLLVRPPISLIESMALGKCVITSSMAGNDELINHNKNGVIADFTTLDAVVDKILFLTKNNIVRNKLGRAARRTIQQLYKNEEYNKIIKIYG